MKTLVLTAFGLIVLATTTASAQPGAIMLYSDNPTFTNCNLIDAAPGLLNVFVVHNFTAGATASQFAVEECGPFELAYLAWTAAHLVTVGGDTRTGVAVSYDTGCAVGPILVGTIAYFGEGTTPPCAYLRVIADPAAASGQIEGVDCGFLSTFPAGSLMSINSDGTCFCVAGGGFPPCNPVPTEESTWGKVKSLYR